MVQLKHTTNNETPIIINIIEQGKQHLKEQGIDQWQDGYPNEAILKEDIYKKRGYCIVHNKQIIGYVCISFEKEEDYEQIDGNWNSKESYVVVHRFVICNEFRGKHFTKDIFSAIEKMGFENQCSSIRIDTHEDNKKMQYVLQKCGFSYCGIVLVGGAKRFAYDKILQ